MKHQVVMKSSKTQLRGGGGGGAGRGGGIEASSYKAMMEGDSPAFKI